MREFCFCNVIARTGFRQDQPIFLLRIVSFVESLFEGTEPALFTSVADIGRLREFRTHFLFIQRAERDTFTAETTVIVFGSGTKRADLGSSTVFTVCTVVEGFTEDAGLFKNLVITYFLGDSSRVFVQFSGNSLERQSVIKSFFDKISGF